jgi:hypothetical protein
MSVRIYEIGESIRNELMGIPIVSREYVIEKNSLDVDPILQQCKVCASIETEARNRDFTMDGLVIECEFDKKNEIRRKPNAKIIDHVHGIKNIMKKRIRTCGYAGTRLYENPSRLLRALRLSIELQFDIDRELLTYFDDKSFIDFLFESNRENTIILELNQCLFADTKKTMSFLLQHSYLFNKILHTMAFECKSK